MPLTPEQRAAHEELDEAIKKVLALQGTEDDAPEPLLVDWMVIIEGVSFRDDGDSQCWHNLLFRGGQCRRTVALGLLDVGLELMEPCPHEEED